MRIQNLNQNAPGSENPNTVKRIRKVKNSNLVGEVVMEEAGEKERKFTIWNTEYNI